MILIVVASAWYPGDSLRAEDRAGVQEAKPDPQLEVNREALLKGSTEQIRIKAASLMLFNPDPGARKVLLDCLAQSDNLVAQAVCKALGQSRTDTNPPPSPDDFIQPLLRLLEAPDQTTAKLAAEGALMFRYDTIGKAIERLANDAAKPVSSRLNAIYALRLQPDMSAAITVVALVDDEKVSVQAREALHAIGIPAGKDPEDRNQIINELKRKSKEEFLRDWLVRQEERMRQERDQTEAWKRLSLQALDRLYATVQDDLERGKFLAEQLRSPQGELKLWALDKLYQWRVAGKPVPQEIVPTLIGLAGDGDKGVRLETAKLLTMMGQVSSPEKLLAQLEVEQDEDVKAKLFLALGVACDYALSSDSGVQMTPEVKVRTLGWADRFVSGQDPNRVRDGAAVVRKLLEKNGLAPREVDRYLARLEQRFRQANLADATLRSELVQVMASLCSSRSACREVAQNRFKPVFEMARSDENDKVREQAVEGFISIDKTHALLNKLKGSIDDRSPKIRKRVFELGGEVGEKEDLDWMAGRIGEGKPDSDLAWQAMSAIFGRSDTGTLRQWLAKLKEADLSGRVTPEQWKSFLQMAERKVGGQTDMARQVLAEMVAYHRQKGDLEEEGGYLIKLLAVTQDPQRDGLTGQLLTVYLRQSSVDKAVQLLQTALDKRDLAPQDPIIGAIEEYVAQQTDRQDHSKIVDAVVRKVSVNDPRPNWDQWRQRWQDHLGRTAEASQADQALN